MRFTRRQIAITILGAAFLAGLGFATSLAGQSAGALLTPEKASQLIAENGVDLLLDVRTPKEYTGPEGHLAGSKLIPVQTLEQRLAEIDEYKDRPVLLYCRTGARSGYASKLLKSKGFTKVYDLSGGILAWKGKGFETVR